MSHSHLFYYFFFFNDTATTEIYTLSLHDALPISSTHRVLAVDMPGRGESDWLADPADYVFPVYLATLTALIARSGAEDRKSTRLNSSHLVISYAVFCLKKKKKKYLLKDMK